MKEIKLRCSVPAGHRRFQTWTGTEPSSTGRVSIRYSDQARLTLGVGDDPPRAEQHRHRENHRPPPRPRRRRHSDSRAKRAPPPHRRMGRAGPPSETVPTDLPRRRPPPGLLSSRVTTSSSSFLPLSLFSHSVTNGGDIFFFFCPSFFSPRRILRSWRWSSAGCARVYVCICPDSRPRNVLLLLRATDGTIAYARGAR